MEEVKDTKEGKTDKQLKLIGIEIAHGKVFHSGQITNPQDIGLVFMPASLMSKEQRKEAIEDRGVVAFYEYMDQAGPRSMNGLPMFHSFHTLTDEENKKVTDAYDEEWKRLKELRDE